jgi:hypothetical protein
MPYGGKTASTTVGLRGGGFDEARINTTDPSNSLQPNPTPAPAVTIGVLATAEAVTSRHDMEVTGTMWGNGPVGTVGPGPSATLECTSCHDPHGNGNYRILRSVPTGSGGAGYTIPDTYPKTPTGYTTTNYFNMYFGANPTNPITEPPGAVAGVSILYDTANWCAQCHTRYLAESGTTTSGKPASGGSRVDSGDAIYTFRHTSMGYGYSSFSPPVGFKYNNRACITCHASHGSNSEMTGQYSQTIEYPGGATPAATPGPGNNERGVMLKMDNRGICRKCHAAQ